MTAPGTILVSVSMSRCCFFKGGSAGWSGDSVSRERFWKSLWKIALEKGEKRWIRVWEGEARGVKISGSEMVMKDELSDAASV